jgi:hypothetical protein
LYQRCDVFQSSIFSDHLAQLREVATTVIANMEDSRIGSQLRVLQRQFFQLVEPQQLRWPENNVLLASQVQSWLFANLFDTDTIRSPPPDRYQLRVLKLLISKLERSINDPEEDV